MRKSIAWKEDNKMKIMPSHVLRICSVILILSSALCYSCASVPSSPNQALCNEGFKAFRNREWNTAIDFYNQALEAEASQNPKQPPFSLCVHLFRPLAYARVGKFEEALSDANLLVKMRPDDPSSYARRCEVLSRYGSHKEALDDCETSLKMKRVRSLMSNKAIALIRSGNINGGLALLDETLNLDEKEPPQVALTAKAFILFAKAEALDEAGISNEAISSYKIALSLSEDAEEAVKNEKVVRALTGGMLGYLTAAKISKFPEGMTKFANQRIADLEKIK